MAKFVFRVIITYIVFLGVLQPVLNDSPKKIVGKNLSLPKPELCAQRKIHQRFGGSAYYVSWFEESTRNLFLNWLDARNFCRDRCQDLISIETPEELQFAKGLFRKGVKYYWTSGRLCDFKGCDRPDLQPKEINGWFWSGSGKKLRPTNEKSTFNDWSHTGGLGLPQPDNRAVKEGSSKYPESCLAYLNDYYKDGIHWHDVGCHHVKSFVCEDSPSLLAYAKSINKNPALKI